MSDIASGVLARSTLVLGGARSGKSAFAEYLAESASPARIYLATGTAGDAEMGERIAHHRARRGVGWRTVEEPLDLAGALARETSEGVPVLVDCLTLWVTNLMLGGHDIDRATQALCASFAGLKGPVIFVSNEVGLGIVPDNAMAREFRDHAGRVNQRVAEASTRVYFIAAGLPLTLKG